ncbi:hypothetical protein BDV93DRAFT_127117 [Ceratobasidium sp. AG-I]|nr:hypothetical protein BDV93DRAFT_127117 [Ceratobasidium sp. AG-I]
MKSARSASQRLRTTCISQKRKSAIGTQRAEEAMALLDRQQRVEYGHVPLWPPQRPTTRTPWAWCPRVFFYIYFRRPAQLDSAHETPSTADDAPEKGEKEDTRLTTLHAVHRFRRSLLQTKTHMQRMRQERANLCVRCPSRRNFRPRRAGTRGGPQRWGATTGPTGPCEPARPKCIHRLCRHESPQGDSDRLGCIRQLPHPPLLSPGYPGREPHTPPHALSVVPARRAATAEPEQTTHRLTRARLGGMARTEGSASAGALYTRARGIETGQGATGEGPRNHPAGAQGGGTPVPRTIGGRAWIQRRGKKQ